MNHAEFWEKYAQLAADDAQQFLKKYLFSLPPDDMKAWLLTDAKSLFAELKRDLDDPSVNPDWKRQIRADLSNARWNLEKLKAATWQVSSRQ